MWSMSRGVNPASSIILRIGVDGAWLQFGAIRRNTMTCWPSIARFSSRQRLSSNRSMTVDGAPPDGDPSDPVEGGGWRSGLIVKMSE